MSATSLFPVTFDGGPRAGEKTETKGEPKRLLALEGSAGLYRFEWDRNGDGVRQRSGVYTWQAPDGAELVEPTSGDEASALIERAGGHMAVKDGASISPVPDLTGKAAESTLNDVADQLVTLEQERQAEPPRVPDARPSTEDSPRTGDDATKVDPTSERTEQSDARARSVARSSASKASAKPTSSKG